MPVLHCAEALTRIVVIRLRQSVVHDRHQRVPLGLGFLPALLLPGSQPAPEDKNTAEQDSDPPLGSPLGQIIPFTTKYNAIMFHLAFTVPYTHFGRDLFYWN